MQLMYLVALTQHDQNLHSEKVIKMSHGSLHLGKKTNRFAHFWVVNCSKMRLAAGLHLDPLI